jgi:serine phosphatase RsbU (regulator of sigma subunit)
MKKQRNEIEIKNKEITSSINRAKMIQDALLPQIEKMKRVFPEMFVMFEPRDIVSGDFFWFAEKGNAIYFAVADCTGHGVPGGFMSMIGHSILNDAINYIDADNPAEILNHLDAEMSKVLNENGHKTADGMDVALIKYDRDTTQMEFSGALRPLIKVSQKKIEKIKGDRQSIGGANPNKKPFTNHILEVTSGDSLYLYSDGYSDQFGGDNNRKYMSKRFNDFLSFANEHVMEDQQYLLQYEFHHWKEDQVDDVLVAGLKIPEAA